MNAPIEQRHIDRANQLLFTGDGPYTALCQLVANADAAARDTHDYLRTAKVAALICPKGADE